MALRSSGTQPLRNGASVVRLGQHIDGIPLSSGELRVLVHADGSLAAVSGTLLPSTKKPRFVSSAAQALERALDRQFGASRPQLAISDAGERGGWQHATSRLDARAPGVQRPRAPRARERQWPAHRGVGGRGRGRLEPGSRWAIPSMPTSSARRYLVADIDGQIVRDVDLIQSDAFVYRAYVESTGVRRPLDGPLQSFAPHPTGVPDGSAPELIPSNLVVMEAFNGPIDPWLANNATTTTGNNAEAFADLDGNSCSAPATSAPRSGRAASSTTPTTTRSSRSPRPTSPRPRRSTRSSSSTGCTTGSTTPGSPRRPATRSSTTSGAAASPATRSSSRRRPARTSARGTTPPCPRRQTARGRACGCSCGPPGTHHVAHSRRVAPIQSEASSAGPRNFDLTGEVVAGDRRHRRRPPTAASRSPATSPARSCCSRSRACAARLATVEQRQGRRRDRRRPGGRRARRSAGVRRQCRGEHPRPRDRQDRRRGAARPRSPRVP